MRIDKSLQRSVLLLACIGMIIPRSCLAQVAVQPATMDVALTAGGSLSGQVVDRQGNAVADVAFQMKQGNQMVVDTRTDELGRFQVKALQGGVYQVAAAGQARQIRVWAPQTAPPNAQVNLTMAVGDIQRGQGCTIDSCTGTCGGTCAACNSGGALGFLMNPWVIGAAVAAAIAIPLALDDDDDAS